MSDINIGALSEAINDKMDRDAQNVDTTAGADVVVEFQVPTSSNNYTWYRKYKSGWVEQGGVWTGSLSAISNDEAFTTVTIPITMSDVNYCPLILNNSGATSTAVWCMWSLENLTVNTFEIHMGAYAGTRTITRITWQVSGMAA